MTGGGNSARAQQRVRASVAPWWAPWRRCLATCGRLDRPYVERCNLTRRHHGRHAICDGFGVRYFDTPRDGTP